MEEWRPAPGYEDYYAVSNFGNVKRTAIWAHGRPKERLAKRIKRGYVVFHLCKNDVRKDVLGHRLTYEAFYGPIPDGYEINHINGKKNDSRLINLEICTRSRNQLHSYRILGYVSKGRGLPGSQNGSSKLSEDDIPRIISLWHSGMRQKDVGKMFGISQRMVSLIVRREKWQHVSVAT